MVLSQDEDDFEADSDKMHYSEFWAVVCFSFIELLIMQSLLKHKSTRLKALGLISTAVTITLSTLAALLITIDLSHYEIKAHKIEYGSEFVLILIDFLLTQLTFGDHNLSLIETIVKWLQNFIMVSAFILAILQFLIYEGKFSCSTPHEGDCENNAHYIEFTVEILNTIFAITSTIITITAISGVLDRIKARIEREGNMNIELLV